MISNHIDIQYLSCPVPGHFNQPLSLVCVDPQCPGNTIMCFSCFRASHLKHSTLPLTEFLHQIDCNYYDKSIQQLLKTSLAQLKRLKLRSLEKIDAVKRRLDVEFVQLEAKLTDYYETIEKTLTAEVERCLEGVTAYEYQPKKGAERLINEVRQLLLNYTENQQHQAFITERMQIALNRITQIQTERTDAYARLAKNVSSAIGWLTRSFQTIDLQKSEWSLRYHHKDISVRGNIITRERFTVNDFEHQSVCALLKQPVQHQSTYTWTFTIKKLVSWLAIGICLQSKTNQYDLSMYNWGSDCHGHYAISSGGCVYAHANQDINCEELGFRFKADDVVRMKYSDGELQFEKIQRNSGQVLGNVKMSVLPPPKGNRYRMCVYMMRVGESVELVDSK